MTKEEDIEREVHEEFTKKTKELAKDLFREAATPPEKPASPEQNLDIIKHLIKRLGTHQIRLDHSAKNIKWWFLALSVVMAIGSIFSVLSFFCK